MNILDSVAQDYLKKDVPAFNVGDQVKVHVKTVESVLHLQLERLLLV